MMNVGIGEANAENGKKYRRRGSKRIEVGKEAKTQFQ
jgi:hypothetical protein